MLLDELKRILHLGGTLSGQVVDVAGFVELHDLPANLLSERGCVGALRRLGHRARGQFDILGRLQDGLCGLLGARDDGFDLTAGAAQHAACRRSRVLRTCLRPRAAHRGVDQVELVLVGLRLGDLCPRPLHLLARHCGARLDQRAQRLQLGHEIAVTRIGLDRGRRLHVASLDASLLFDAKNLALYRHDHRLLRSGLQRAL